MIKIYGDGIHDDTLGIQALLDTKAALVELPMPEKHYLISSPLVVYSGQELKLARYCHIKLAAQSNCYMLKNDWSVGECKNITVCGGIWDYNNLEQKPNPFLDGGDVDYMNDEFTYGMSDKYYGFAMMFFGVKHLTIKDLTIKDPITFACSIDTVSYFTIENIVFDFNRGNPLPINMDGIHLTGNCHFGLIRNIKGATYDDMIALNSDEGSGGPITNIEIDGLYAESAQSFIRLLSAEHPVKNIHIHNLFGTCFMYGIGITKYWYEKPFMGYFEGLVFDNIHISRGEPVIGEGSIREGLDTFGIISFDKQTHTRSLHISNLYRNETHTPVPTVEIQNGATVENISIENSCTSSSLDTPVVFVKNDGEVKELYLKNVRSEAGDFWIGNKAGFEIK